MTAGVNPEQKRFRFAEDGLKIFFDRSLDQNVIIPPHVIDLKDELIEYAEGIDNRTNSHARDVQRIRNSVFNDLDCPRKWRHCSSCRGNGLGKLALLLKHPQPFGDARGHHECAHRLLSIPSRGMGLAQRLATSADTAVT